jgi:hypothetical protein
MNQPEPPPQSQPVNSPSIWPLVITDMRERNEVGHMRYGVYLHPYDGRRTLIDAYQEALDLCVYLRKEIYERYGE